MINVTKSCIFCGRWTDIEVHHCLHGTANRAKADADGLTVYCCHECHMKLHQDPNSKWMDAMLKEMAEAVWLAKNTKEGEPPNVDGFRGRYGKNYL